MTADQLARSTAVAQLVAAVRAGDHVTRPLRPEPTTPIPAPLERRLEAHVRRHTTAGGIR